MTKAFEELAYARTPLGELSLRRRRLHLQSEDIFEIKLGDEFLMSSLFTASETALADISLQRLTTDNLDVVVGGLGLGYTAAAVLRNTSVRSLYVIEKFPEVIEWHRKEVVPLGRTLSAHPRCHFLEGDFFELFGTAVSTADEGTSRRRFNAMLIDIDHSPSSTLSDNHKGFYTPEGLQAASTHLRPGGIFAIWSNDPPDDTFLGTLRSAFDDCSAEVIRFDNPLQRKEATNTIYLARARGLLPQAHRSQS